MKTKIITLSINIAIPIQEPIDLMVYQALTVVQKALVDGEVANWNLGSSTRAKHLNDLEDGPDLEGGGVVSTNTGGPAFPQPNHVIDTDRGREEARGWMADSGMTMLDWMAGQALVGLLACPAGSGCADGNAETAYDYASAMLAEKARREAVVPESSTTDHSPDSGKMVRHDLYVEALLIRNDALDQVAKLEALNRELVEALNGMVSSAHKRLEHEELNGDAISAASTRGTYCALRDALHMAKQTIAKAKEIA